MDQNDDPGSVLSPTTSLLRHDSLNHHQDPAFIHEFTPQHRIPPNEQEDDEYATTLLARENNGHHFGSASPDKAWIHRSRLNSIEWVLKSRVRLGFRYRTAYLSIMYFDRFLSLQWTALQGKGRDWRMRLLALTCLSLAAKMEEVKVPKLPAYGGGDAEFSFESKWIKRMELRVLNALQWEMRFVTPFCFIHFFIRYLFQPGEAEAVSVSRTALIFFQAAKATSTMEFKPSVMAMAATLLVMDESLTVAAVEAKISESAVSSYGFAATAEQVYSCYEKMKRVLHDDRALLLPSNESPISSGSSGVSQKRRRLV